MLGFSQDDLTGRRLEDQVPPGMARRHHENVRTVISTGIPYEHEELFPTAAGQKRLDIKLSPIKGPDGAVISVVVIARDITRRTTRKQGRPGRKIG
jgi:PAS domain S-box-containing protein